MSEPAGQASSRAGQSRGRQARQASSRAPERTSRLRVALVGDYPVREDAIHAGGVQSVTHGLAHALARRPDVECHVVCATRNPGSDSRRNGDLHVHFVARPPLPRLATCHLYDVPRLVKQIRAIAPDIVHGQGQDRHGLAAVRCGLPCVITPHGVIFLETPLLKRSALDFAGALKQRIMDGIEREIFRRAPDMIVISRYLPDIYGPMLTARKHFIENPIDAEFFSLARDPRRGRLLFAGTVVPRKRVEDLVRATARLVRLAGDGQEREVGGSLRLGTYARPVWSAGLQLRIVGPLTDAGAVASVRTEVAAAGIAERVVLTGPLSQQDLYEEYRCADILVLASREETAPQVIAQAMACGLPVVSSNGGGVPHMVRDGETALLFPVGDFERCAAQIRRLLDDDALRAAITARAREEARQRFHPDAVAAQTVAAYRTILSVL